MLSFPEAISESVVLIQRLEADPQLDVRAELTSIVQSAEGARGFFVSLLTENWRFGDHIPSIIIEAIKQSKEITYDLLVKNLVMSTATRIAHQRSKNQEQVAGSTRVARRTSYIIAGIGDEALLERMKSMVAAIEKTQDVDSQMEMDEKAEEFVAFLKRWSYDAEQLNAAGDAVKACMD